MEGGEERRNPFRCGYVALVGEPNVGKSTLMNQLVRQKLAIVSPKPQTTRRRTLGIVSGDGYQIVLLDTPGILEPRYPLQKAMMRTVGEALRDVDLACLLLDERALAPGADLVPENVRAFPGVRIAALNKIDRIRHKEEMIPILQALSDTGFFAEIVPISAIEGDGVDRLLASIVANLPEAPPFYPADQLTEQPERFFVGELIREEVFLMFAEEVPYAVEIEVEEFKERPGAKDFIAATVLVEQSSQKGILIGRGGQMIRSLGEASRTAIEAFLDRPVYLELRVKVAPKWRRDEATLKRLGYRP